MFCSKIAKQDLPVLTNYYYAALLGQLRAWLTLSNKLWVSIVQAVSNQGLPSLLLIKTLAKLVYLPMFPSIQALLEALEATLKSPSMNQSKILIDIPLKV